MPRPKTPTTYHARGDEALANGSFIRKSGWGLYEYINGDAIGYRPRLPGGLKEYTAVEALKLIPKGIL